MARSPLRSLSQIHMCLPYPLPCHYPDCGFQEGASLAVGSRPSQQGFCTLSRPLLIQAGRFTRWNEWSPHCLPPPFRGKTASMSSFVSRQRPGDELRARAGSATPRISRGLRGDGKARGATAPSYRWAGQLISVGEIGTRRAPMYYRRSACSRRRRTAYASAMCWSVRMTRPATSSGFGVYTRSNNPSFLINGVSSGCFTRT